MKLSLVTLPALAILVTTLAWTPARVSAQSVTGAAGPILVGSLEPIATIYPVTQTRSGNFKSTDGNSGTFVNTITATSATTKEEVVVFTRSSDGKTKTDTTNTTINGDGSRTVAYSSVDYGASAPFTSNKTLTKEKHGQFVGTGTFTTATGTGGILTTLETKAETVNVVSAVYNDSTTGITNDLRLEDDGFGFVTTKHLNLDPTGKLTEEITTRYITSSK